MKATFELPTELYREVKARSALEGRPVREVVIGLLSQWLAEKPEGETEGSATGARWRTWKPPAKKHLRKKVTDHSMEAVRESIAGGYDGPH